MAMKSDSPIIIKNKDGLFQLLDDDHHTLETKAAQRGLAIFAPYFEDPDQRTFKEDLTYVQLLELVKKLNRRLQRKGLPEVQASNKFNQFVQQRQYYIKEQSQAGLTIKDGDPRWQHEFDNFKAVVSQEITRPLKPEQEKASFFMTIMKRAANFSVPGAGKTAMMYGTFAYLSSPRVNEVDKLLVVSPLNAFAAWRTEFEAVFGPKRKLHYLNMRDKKYNNNVGAIKHDWVQADVITINYESLQSKLNIINDLLDSKTMLVFDEVHRVKGVGGQRAKAALSLSQTPHYRYVLTGTPIPNGFRDIYNFLHLMYPDEYSSFFAWDLTTLNNIDPEDVNKKLSPFFWRTNKKDLHVPKPDPDIIKEVEPSKNQQMLSQAIYETENGTLATFIRLLQASTNPELLATNINYKELGLVDADSGVWDKQASTVEKENASSGDAYKKYDLAKVESPKFEMGIDLIDKLVSQGKKVLVWGMFVGTMQKITDTLNDMGIKTTLVYGATPKQDREGMINNFRTGDAQVLVSNPNTLGESISLHQTVHDAVYFEYNFNLTFMLQSRDRINRLGLPANQYTRYYYLMTKGDVAHMGFIDSTVYKKLKDKEKIMLDAIDGQLLVPEYTDDYLQEVKDIVMGRYK
ncbi:DEAD/DEAH box helicase [Limosilactobacillus reuteri]|jgi:SNF2 family DNA or RNA helicase|uniref:SNF2-related protein n=1 Tax=Limosilactobacillus reuteri TaxID=1598 RepID=UPI000A2DDBC6|nr:DEAD/DEAH box helicase [Limosilactobacillus reuteri]MCC4340709.1 DEAD/DEAH box helicase [Limosilactobacillus reuteri]MCC4351015.1 DEAD/DEAH box helicase [Limosilactobacillus reuteri]MCC4360179.1 DEAD/DEAH box helicase [Limosilactobacillus reuteri]MCC4378841.1 DEAD/DEAH box helicase [Limosilactobacillus reuteri]MCC4408365.1 DEAD/DEAH box helicase [Limosilactobacillus reuteri]